MDLSSTSANIVREKTAQAVDVLKEKNIDLWITFVRETPQIKDPMVDLIVGFELTWTTALLIHRNGKRVAIAGRFDVPNLQRLGAYDEVISYDASFEQALIDAVTAFNPRSIVVNYSESDPAADGLTYGMYRVLTRTLAVTPYTQRIGSAAAVISALRGRKTASEVRLIKSAIQETQVIIGELQPLIRPGVSDVEIADFLHNAIEERGYGPAWEWEYCPVVTVGPESVFGHGMPEGLVSKAGNLIHIDFGIQREGFVSDLQRTWYLAKPGEDSAPDDVIRAWNAVSLALEAGRAALIPGAQGWQVDHAARSTLVNAGYPEYMHAFGHQVGRTAHDGATVLGPRWERYGTSIDGLIEENNVFAIELEVLVEGRGYVSREENVLVTEQGAIFLSEPQEDLWIIKA